MSITPFNKCTPKRVADNHIWVAQSDSHRNFLHDFQHLKFLSNWIMISRTCRHTNIMWKSRLYPAWKFKFQCITHGWIWVAQADPRNVSCKYVHCILWNNGAVISKFLLFFMLASIVNVFLPLFQSAVILKSYFLWAAVILKKSRVTFFSIISCQQTFLPLFRSAVILKETV